MSTSTRPTLEEFLALPETKPGNEYIDGEVVQNSMPTTDHAIIQRLLSLVFGLVLRAPDRGGRPGVAMRVRSDRTGVGQAAGLRARNP